MAWPFKQKEEPVADANKPPVKSEVDELIEKFSDTIDAKLAPIGEKVGKMQERWDALEAEANKPPVDPNAEPPKPPTETELRLQQQIVLTNARMIERDVISQISSDWPNVVAAVQADFAKTPWQRKAMVDYAEFCQNVVNMRVGEEAKKQGLRFDGASKRFFLEDQSAGGGEGDNVNSELRQFDWQDPKSGKTLTGKQQLEKLGIDPKKFVDAASNGRIN
jgi:hypothetical protein